MTDKGIIIDGKIIGCPCYIDRPLHRYDKGCLVQSQAFKEQQTEEKPILRCDEIKNCPIKENFKQLQCKTAECEKLKEKWNIGFQKFCDKDNELQHYKQALDSKNVQTNSYDHNDKILKTEELINQMEADYQYYTQELKTLRDIISNKEKRNAALYLTSNHYRKALDEIEEYCENEISITGDLPFRTIASDILDIISKAKDGIEWQ